MHRMHSKAYQKHLYAHIKYAIFCCFLANSTLAKTNADAKRAALPTPEILEQTKMDHIASALPTSDTAHWPIQTSPSGTETKVILVESPYESRKERGNLLVLAPPGVYPYQARWYPGLKQHLTSQGWNFMSLGLAATPKAKQAPTRHNMKDVKESKITDLKAAYAKEYQETFAQWQSDAITRGQILTSFSSSKQNSSEEILIAVGKSAFIAGLISAEPSTKLTGLVLIDFEAPDTEEAMKLNEALSAQGPILEVVLSTNPDIRRAARKRLQTATQLGNRDYRLEFAPTGLQLSHPATPWLGQLIHGWAMTNMKE